MNNEEEKESKSKFIPPQIDNSNSIVERVESFLSKISFKRTFPLNLIELAKAMNYSIFYLVDTDEYKYIEAAIDSKRKFIALNTRFKKSYLCGRYIICKMIAHIALDHIPEGAIWTESVETKRDAEDNKLNPDTASFAYELLMPEKDFKEQWEKLGHNIGIMSSYFMASQTHIIQRKCYLFKDGNNG